MNKFFKSIWLAASVFLAITYIVASCSSFISPRAFNYIALLGIAFPFILLATIIALVLSIFVNKKAALCLLIALPFGWYNIQHSYAFHLKKLWQQQKAENNLRIMTWNVESFVSLRTMPGFTEERDSIFAIITRTNPDVLCLQEYDDMTNSTMFVSPHKFLDSIGYHYSAHSNDVVRTYGKSVFSKGTVIYSKTPLLNTATVQISDKGEKEKLVYADIEFNKKPVRIFTAHLLSFFLYTDTSRARDAGEDVYRKTYHRKRLIQYKIRENEAYHEEQVTLIRNLLDQSPNPVIYCGDLNTTPVSHNFRMLKGNLQDAFLVKGSGIGATFYKLLPTLRIDACFVDKRFNINQCMVIQKKFSDHYPVITDISWK